MSDAFERKSGLGETAHFQHPTPRGYPREHISNSEQSWDKASENHGQPLHMSQEAHWLLGTRLWIVGALPPWQGSRVKSQQVGGLFLYSRTCVPQGKLDVGMEYDMGLSVEYPEAPLPESLA